MESVNQISGNIVDVLNNRIYPGTLHINNKRITNITEQAGSQYDTYIIPGFVDAHVHIESSMLTPYEFARMAVVHGTVATVSDPHEIGNVLGVEGVEYMLDNAVEIPFKFNFGAPSCVPATTFETAGANISVDDVDALLQRDDIRYLSEMMNFPGVLFKDATVMAKIALAKKYNKPIDGHAPGLRGEKAAQYISAGISTDHECFTLPEALDKLDYGMKILIREGSAAKNYDALSPLLLVDAYADRIMFCSDDKHPNDLVVGHINELVKRSVDKGFDVMKVLRCACINPVQHYNLPVGLLQKGDPADFVIIDNLQDLRVLETYIDGFLMAENGQTRWPYKAAPMPNNFHSKRKKVSDFLLAAKSERIRVIEALEGQLITNPLEAKAKVENGFAVSNVAEDVLKLVVVNRYQDAPPAVAFIKNFGLQRGAIASSVAHDSHNIIAVGVDDADICEAVNLLIDAKGGLSVCDLSKNIKEVLPLPVAGIMTAQNGYEVAEAYTKIDKLAKSLGTPLYAPYMTLSFMALLVIPSLKLSDLGLFDGGKFVFTDVFVDETGDVRQKM